jgi:hypothetical protein
VCVLHEENTLFGIQYSLSYEEEDTFQALRAWNAHVCVYVALFVCVCMYVCIIHVDIE